MSWKSEIITEINEGKKDALDHEIDSQIKVGTLIEYVINKAGNLTLHKSKIKKVEGDAVTLEDDYVLDINLAKLSVLHSL